MTDAVTATASCKGVIAQSSASLVKVWTLDSCALRRRGRGVWEVY